MLPHRIRLRGPWQIVSAAGAPTVRLPDEWDALGSEPVRLVRHFGWPSPLAAHERVWLIFDKLTAACEARLNEKRLGRIRTEVAVTGLLPEGNELQVDVPAGAQWNEAALEVRGRAWLSELGAEWRSRALIVRGRLNGTADAPLDLYAILDRRTVIQTALRAEAFGSFELQSEPVPTADWPADVRVELIEGSTIWHAADVPISQS